MKTIGFAGAAALLLAAMMGGTLMSQQATTRPAEVPPIDTKAPETFETATFALG